MIEHLYHIRKNISNTGNAEFLRDIGLTIDRGVLAIILEILEGKKFDHPLLLQEASWCISNMVGSSSQEHCSKVVKANGVAIMTNLFVNNDNYAIIDNVIFIFGQKLGFYLNFFYHSAFISSEIWLEITRITVRSF